MQLHELDQSLPVVDGALTLSASTLPAADLGPLLATFNRGAPLVIRDASKVVTADSVEVRGATTFLNVAGASVAASFRLDAAGNPVVLVRVALAERAPWSFSTSFPDMPVVFSADGTRRGALDDLSFLDPAFVLASAQASDAATGAGLARGLNFLARLQPTGLVAAFDALVGGGTPLVQGLVTVPDATARAAPLPLGAYPWAASPAPGIDLRADLGIHVEVSGAFTLSPVLLRFYSPATAAWAAANPTYAPVSAALGAFSAPGAGIRADLSGTLAGGTLTLWADLAGATLSDLAMLESLCPGADLFSALPAEMQSLGRGLGGLALEGVGLSFSNSAVPVAVGFRVGMPNASWTLLDGFSARGFTADFGVSEPFTQPAVALTLGAAMDILGADFDASVQLPENVASVRLARSASLKVGDLFRRYAPELAPAPGTPSDHLDLAVDAMEFVVAPGRAYSATAVLASSTPWRLDIGPAGVTIEDVSLSFSKDAGAPAQGAFAGTLVIDDALRLAASYRPGGPFTLRADAPTLDVKALIRALDEVGLDLPKGFALDLGPAYALVEQDGAGLRMTVSAEVEGLGTVAFTAAKAARWGFALGIDLACDAPSSVPWLSALHRIEKDVGLEDAMVVLSSLDQPGFEFPATSAFETPALSGPTMRLPPAAGGGLAQGLNVYAKLSLRDNPAFAALARALGVKLDGSLGVALGVSLPDPATRTQLAIDINGKLAGQRVRGTLGLLMRGPDVDAFLQGEMPTTIEGAHVIFDVAAQCHPNGVMVMGTMRPDPTAKDGPTTVRIGHLKLAELALVVGMDFEGIPSLGIAADLVDGGFEAALAVFFDSTDPSQSMVSGAVSGLTLLDAARTLAGQADVPSGLADILRETGLHPVPAASRALPASLAASLDAGDVPAVSAACAGVGLRVPSTRADALLIVGTPGKTWFLTDLTRMTHYMFRAKDGAIGAWLEPQFRFAPRRTVIGALPPFPAGVRVAGAFEVAGVDGTVDAEGESTRGIYADVDVDPMVVVSRTFFAITGANGKGGPRMSLATCPRPDAPDPTRAQPHFLLSGALTLLGQVVESVDVRADGRGFAFDLKQASPTMTLDIQGGFTGATDLKAGGRVTLGLDRALDLGALGRTRVTTQLQSSLSAGAAPKGAYATLTGSFAFAGRTFSIGTVTLDANGPALANLADEVWDDVRRAIEAYLADADAWLGWVRGGVMQGMDDAAKVAQTLAHEYHRDAQAVASALHGLAYGADATAAALRDAASAGLHATQAQVASALKGAGYATQEVAAALESAYDLSVNAVAALLKDAGCAAGEVGDALAKGLHATSTQTAAALDAAGYPPEDVARAVGAAYNLGADAVAKVMQDAGASADEISRALKNVYGWSADQTSKFLKDTLHMDAGSVTSAMNAAGYAAAETSKAVEGAYKSTTKAVEDTAKDAGKALESTAKKANPKHWF